MARFVLLCVVALISVGSTAAEDKKDVPKELAPFQGSWKVVEASMGDTPTPKDELPELRFDFVGAKLTVTRKGKAETGSYSVDAKKNPAAIDLTDPKGEKAPGIYKFDKNGRLTITFTKLKDSRPQGFDDKDAVTLVLEKVKK